MPDIRAFTNSGLACTVSFVNTTSPGVSIAGTVSPLPLPGTSPPCANFFGTRPLTAPFAPGTALNNPGEDAANAWA